MSSGNKEHSDHISLKNYFLHNSQNLAANVFDQIVDLGSDSTLMTGENEIQPSIDILETCNTSAHLGPLDSTLEITDAVEVSNTAVLQSELFNTDLSHNFDIFKEDNHEDLSKGEPVMCKIFSSQDATDCSSLSGEMFFDMLNRPQLSVPSSVVSGKLQAYNSPFTKTSSTTLSTETITASSHSNTSFQPKSNESKKSFSEIQSDDSCEVSPIFVSETDRQRDAWIPCDKIKKVLVSVVVSPPGTYFPEKDFMTMPGIIMEEELTDTVFEVTKHYLGEAEASKRRVMTANSVTQDERGLRELIQAGCFRAAVNLSGRLLTIYGQGLGRAGQPTKHSVHSVQLWFTRIALLVKLRNFHMAELESEPFGDLDHPDLYYQFYPELYGGRSGSLVPFSFRVLLAELPQYSGKSLEALHKLYNLLSTVRKIITNLDSNLSEDGSPYEVSPNDRNESRKLWSSRESRVMHSIINCAVYQKDFCLAIEVLELMLQTYDWSVHHRKFLQSVLGRIYLQLGDMNKAETCFIFGKELKLHHGAGSSDVNDFINRGLLAVAQNAFQDAYQYFKKASDLDPTNIMLLNNMAVCLLYQGQLREALSILEGGVKNDPCRALHESVLLNACTLYELETSFSNQRKLSMLSFLSQYKGDGISVSCLKLQM